jgi:glucokinase
MIVAGDIGGTNTRLAFFTGEGNRLISVIEETFPSRTHSGLAEIVRQVMSAHKLSPAIACFGIAGPVKNGRVETTNLPWIVDALLLANELHIPTVLLINDLEATAYGVTTLALNRVGGAHAGAPDAAGQRRLALPREQDWGKLGSLGRPSLPSLCYRGRAHRLCSAITLELELLHFLLAKFDRVSYERVQSGPGLVNIYQFLR